jgi:hypothetical protein
VGDETFDLDEFGGKSLTGRGVRGDVEVLVAIPEVRLTVTARDESLARLAPEPEATRKFLGHRRIRIVDVDPEQRTAPQRVEATLPVIDLLDTVSVEDEHRRHGRLLSVGGWRLASRYPLDTACNRCCIAVARRRVDLS